MNTEQSFLEELLIVMVVFEKDPLKTSAFQSLNSIRKEALLMIYDNSSLPSQVDIENTIYLHDASNPGVSKAYNTAGTFAKSRNKKWLMLADQDTKFPECFFEKYQVAINTFPGIKIFVPLLSDQISLVSPFAFRHGKGKRIKVPDRGVYDLLKFRFMNSGLVVALDAFEAVGGYDERFFLDYSDIVFANRIANIHTNFTLVDVSCDQQFSGSESVSDLTLLKRFNTFCNAVILYKKIVQSDVPHYWVLLSRAIKLSLQQRNILFLARAIAVLMQK